MPKPKTKSELLQLSQKNFEKLFELIESRSEVDQLKEFLTPTMNRNIRDVLAHLHHWHLMMLNWYEVGMSGEKPDMPAKGYTWRTTSDLNRWIRDHYQSVKLSEIKQLLSDSYHQVQKIIASHSNEELFEKKKYHWTGSTSLGAYLISNTSSHYDWAFKLIKKNR